MNKKITVITNDRKNINKITINLILQNSYNNVIFQ